MSDQPPMGMSGQDFLSDQPPAMGPGGLPPSGGDPKGKLAPPAIALIVLGALGALLGLWSVASSTINYLNPEAAVAAQAKVLEDMKNAEIPEEWMSVLEGYLSQPPGVWPIVMSVVGVLCSLLSVLGGVSMLKQKLYGVCILGAVAGMLPISSCCCLGLPFGIWAIIVLMNADVKAAFRSKA